MTRNLLKGLARVAAIALIPAIGFADQWYDTVRVAESNMSDCLQRLPKPNAGPERDVEKVLERYVATCGQALMRVLRSGGTDLTERGVMAWAVMDAYQAMGCVYLDANDPDALSKPEGTRPITCR
jgi:hypothetical protein